MCDREKEAGIGSTLVTAASSVGAVSSRLSFTCASTVHIASLVDLEAIHLLRPNIIQFTASSCINAFIFNCFST